MPYKDKEKQKEYRRQYYLKIKINGNVNIKKEDHYVRNVVVVQYVNIKKKSLDV